MSTCVRCGDPKSVCPCDYKEPFFGAKHIFGPLIPAPDKAFVTATDRYQSERTAVTLAVTDACARINEGDPEAAYVRLIEFTRKYVESGK